MTGCSQVTTAIDADAAAEAMAGALVSERLAAGDPPYLDWIERETTPLTPETR